MSAIEKNFSETAEGKGKRRMFWVILAAALIGSGVLIWLREPNGPVYEGRTVREWFDEASDKRDSLYSSRSPSARDAFEYFGARAQPFLLRWAQKEPPALVKFRDRWLPSLPKWMQTWTRKIHSQQWYVERRRLALQALGFVEQWERGRPGGNKHAAVQLATKSLPVLIRALTDTDQTIRLSAAHSLRNLGENAWPAIPNLIESATDSYLQVAIVSLQTLGGLGGRASNAVPTLAGIACGQTNLLRMEAVKTLGAIGPAARSVSPILASFLTNDMMATQSGDQNEADELAERLKGSGRLPPKRSLASEQFDLLKVVRRVNSWPPSNAVKPLALTLPPRSGITSVVALGNTSIALTVPNDRDFREAVANALVVTVPPGRVVAYGNTSIALTVPSGRDFREAVANALVEIGEVSDATAPALERMLQPEGPNRAALAVAMWQRNPANSTVQQYIVATMRSDDWLHRVRAVRLLGEAGTNAAVFLPELRRLLKDSDLLVRKCATSAVERVTWTPP